MRDRLMAETKAALKAQNKPRLSALRLNDTRPADG